MLIRLAYTVQSWLADTMFALRGFSAELDRIKASQRPLR